MNDRRITEKRPEPTPVLRILRQIESLNYKDFITMSEILGVTPSDLSSDIATGITEQKEGAK